jgi:hypothetical protein
LIVVVVLPTPPFWLATASVPRIYDCGSDGTLALPDCSAASVCSA